MLRVRTFWSSALLCVALLFAVSASAALAREDTKEVTCGHQWCKVTCNSVKATAHCQGNQKEAVLCACFGEKAGGSIAVSGCRKPGKEECSKTCAKGHPDGSCGTYGAACYC
jgi:hypothetical protein